MAKSKKTVNVKETAEKFQRAILMDNRTEEELSALVFCLETILFDSGNYKGFQFINADGTVDLSPEMPEGIDRYRRRYYLPA